MTLPADFLVLSAPSPIPGDNSSTLTVFPNGENTVPVVLKFLKFPGPNGKLESDIAFRKLWSGDIRL